MLKVGQDGGVAASNARLIAAIKRADALTTFVSLLPPSDLVTSALTKAQATQQLKQLPFKFQATLSLDQLRELCAARVWCENVMQTAGDIQALPSNLHAVLETWFEIPMLSNTARAASAVALWKAVQPLAGQAPPAVPAPLQPPAPPPAPPLVPPAAQAVYYAPPAVQQSLYLAPPPYQPPQPPGSGMHGLGGQPQEPGRRGQWQWDLEAGHLTHSQGKLNSLRIPQPHGV